MVTCKEPLRVSIGNHLRALLQTNVNESQRALIEHAVQTVCTDNLDAACSVIEKATMEKAVAQTDEALTPALDARIKHREVCTLFLDLISYIRFPMLCLPHLHTSHMHTS